MSPISRPSPTTPPEDFGEVSGSITLYGSMTGNDKDGYFWTVSDEDACKRWTLELHGIPGALTITQVFRLEYAENSVDAIGKTTLMKMGTRDGSRPSIHGGLIFEPGQYVLGLAQSGSKLDGGGPFRPSVGGLSFEDGGATDEAEEVDTEIQ